MKKKFLLGAVLTLFIALSAYAATCYTCISDPCGKCYIDCDGTTRECGKCGGWLNSQKSELCSDKGYTVQAWFKCKKCGHQSKWKW